MKKQKFIAILVITSLIASVFFNFILVGSVNADETPTITTSVYSSDKSIKVDIKNINLDETHQYKFGVSSSKGAQPTNWYDLVEIDGNSAWFVITPIKEDMRKVLIASDNAYIFIKDSTDNASIMNGERISISLPAEDAFNFKFLDNNKFSTAELYSSADRLYNNCQETYKSVKIEDNNIIKKYLDAKTNNKNTINEVKDILDPIAPPITENWRDYGAYTNGEIETDEGLYYLWFRKMFTTGRIVTGYTLYDTYPTGYKLAESESTQSTSANSEDQNKTSNTEGQSGNSQIKDKSRDTQTQGSTQTENEQSIVEALQGQESNAKEQTNTYNSNNSNSEKSDTTVATTKIPQTGQGMAIAIATIGTVGIAAFAYNASKKYKGIK